VGNPGGQVATLSTEGATKISQLFQLPNAGLWTGDCEKKGGAGERAREKNVGDLMHGFMRGVFYGKQKLEGCKPAAKKKGGHPCNGGYTYTK